MKLEPCQYFPSLMILLDIAAASAYLAHKDLWRVGYWIAAAVLTFCMTFGMKQ